ncbi:hypothetical protein HMPREF0063_10113 [Aeromicrobium marinum DSM 15272]|uniref:Uncharacterized protein n=1 Tax=Aeromicrobium marinum DSM 15272 TaxID=585531 RepID=E2S7V6_9ACTN|nr:hypothetical protein [Aeromicrobium marinum]EFQ84772.1 hypothetical protein HMPREF0063_10113 [Aeromicrobium marinum DSM 15272]
MNQPEPRTPRRLGLAYVPLGLAWLIGLGLIALARWGDVAAGWGYLGLAVAIACAPATVGLTVATAKARSTGPDGPGHA